MVHRRSPRLSLRANWLGPPRRSLTAHRSGFVDAHAAGMCSAHKKTSREGDSFMVHPARLERTTLRSAI